MTAAAFWHTKSLLFFNERIGINMHDNLQSENISQIRFIMIANLLRRDTPHITFLFSRIHEVLIRFYEPHAQIICPQN
jgi:hypothetical protein